MASFMTSLFESIFTPGPTHTLLVATNIAFACLQLVLLLLLIATYSIHFVVLSGLSAGLWWSINWFVAELRVSEAEEAARKAKAEEEIGAVDEGGDDTEGETVVGEEGVVGTKGVEVLDRSAVGEVKDRRGLAGVGLKAGAAGKELKGSRSEASTEDEWERVSENENEKDK